MKCESCGAQTRINHGKTNIVLCHKCASSGVTQTISKEAASSLEMAGAAGHEFKAYKHSVFGYEVIKQGFSWPGFFFTWIWAFIKKLWVVGIVLLIVAFTANSIAIILSGQNIIFSLFGFIVTLIPMLVAGARGNKWREKSMLQRGFEYIGTVRSGSADAALAKASNL